MIYGQAEGKATNVFMTKEERENQMKFECTGKVESFTTVKFIKPPKYVGWIVMPGSMPGFETKFATLRKPNWLARKLLKLFMDIGWKEYK